MQTRFWRLAASRTFHEPVAGTLRAAAPSPAAERLLGRAQGAWPLIISGGISDVQLDVDVPELSSLLLLVTGLVVLLAYGWRKRRQAA